MKISYQWLSEYVDATGYSASDLAEKLNRSGIEVDVVEKRNKGIEGIVVGYVAERNKHPDADKLSVCVVDIGEAQKLQIVCGASNISAGQKVPVAVVGAVLPGDFRIKQAKLRGVESQGMICSAKELGLNEKLLPKEQQEGILVLPDSSIIGASVLELLGIDDEVMELDLTPNRSDCLSMIGAAYEIAAIIGRDVHLPDIYLAGNDEKANSEAIVKQAAYEPLIHNQTASHISVSITAKEYCSHYSARRIENVKLGVSPLWMQNRLMAAGLRPINNIVDITNYVMLEYGQPLHAFDADAIEGGHIEIRMAKRGETLETLDGQVRKLDEDMLVIADAKKAIALAGVMGGANSEVTATTKHIILESAKFAGGSVRKTSKRLGLRSEASLRFEKEVDPNQVIPALNRAALLMMLYAEGKATDGIAETERILLQELVIPLSVSKVNRYLGTSIAPEEIKNILLRLHFSFMEQSEDELLVSIPSRRGDITLDVDLIEEVARLYGYDRIPTTIISGDSTAGSLTRKQHIHRALRSLLTQCGLHETITYSFTTTNTAATIPGLFPTAKPIKLAMPMSEEYSTLRTSLLPKLLEVITYNRNRNINDIQIFELGNVFITDEKQLTRQPTEKLMLAAAITGLREERHWAGKGNKVDFYDLKGIVERVLQYLAITNVRFKPAQHEGFHPGRTAEVWLTSAAGDQCIGLIGQLHPSLQKERDLDQTFVVELEVEKLTSAASYDIRYQVLPKYPSIVRDIALVVDTDAAAGDVEAEIRKAAGALLESVEPFDIYTGDRLAAGKKSIAFSIVYRHLDRTLTDDEISEAQSRILTKLEERFDAVLRK